MKRVREKVNRNPEKWKPRKRIRKWKPRKRETQKRVRKWKPRKRVRKEVRNKNAAPSHN